MKVRILAVAAAIASITAQQPAFPQVAEAVTVDADLKHLRVLTEYPVLQAGQTEYTIPASDANLYIDTLHFSANLNIKVDPSIKEIKWTVRNVIIDQGNSTLDLSAPRGAAATGSHGAKYDPWQADYCKVGAQGHKGGRGADGAASASLEIVGVRGIENHGSLWIRSDGQPGGTGGVGGEGQKGGGGKHRFIGGCGFATGGGGGEEGDPGNGGIVSKVSITTEAMPDRNVLNPVVDTAHCSPTYSQQRPSGAQPDSGVIAATGVPGCLGNRGKKGPDGPEGEERR